MTKGTLKEKISRTLEDISYNLGEAKGSQFFWGEIEVPECLKREIENANDAE